VRAGYSSRASGERKGRSPHGQDVPVLPDHPPRWSTSPSLAESALQVVAMRAALDGTAHQFDARLRQCEEGQP
jgi:hypothetical protein